MGITWASVAMQLLPTQTCFTSRLALCNPTSRTCSHGLPYTKCVKMGSLGIANTNAPGTQAPLTYGVRTSMHPCIHACSSKCAAHKISVLRRGRGKCRQSTTLGPAHGRMHQQLPSNFPQRPTAHYTQLRHNGTLKASRSHNVNTCARVHFPRVPTGDCSSPGAPRTGALRATSAPSILPLSHENPLPALARTKPQQYATPILLLVALTLAGLANSQAMSTSFPRTNATGAMYLRFLTSSPRPAHQLPGRFGHHSAADCQYSPPRHARLSQACQPATGCPPVGKSLEEHAGSDAHPLHPVRRQKPEATGATDVHTYIYRGTYGLDSLPAACERLGSSRKRTTSDGQTGH